MSNNEQPWEHLYEVYTGHADIRDIMKKFKDYIKEADKIYGEAKGLISDARQLNSRAQDLQIELGRLSKKLRKGGIPYSQQTALDNAIEELQLMRSHSHKADFESVNSSARAGNSAAQLDDASDKFDEQVQDGTFVP